MKTHSTFTLILSALSLAAVTVSSGEPTAAPAPRAAGQTIAVSGTGTADAVMMAGVDEDERAKLLKDLAATQSQYGEAQNNFERWMEPFKFSGRRNAGPGKALVIRSSDSDPAAQANLEEDQTVMTHILDKAVDETVGESRRGRTAMGIDLAFAPGSNPVRSVYLDGYGALFMLRVNIPLLAPPKAKEESKEKPAADSSWEEARREVYGQPGEPKAAAGPAEEFDADKVNQLKDALIDALKSATNIRGLKADDWVTLCVFGSSGASGKARTVMTSRNVRAKSADDSTSATGGGGGSGGATIRSAPDRHSAQWSFNTTDGYTRRGTVMTLRVKKSDVDAFAKGKLSLDDFRRKVSLTVYQGGSESDNFSSAVSNFNNFIYQYQH